VRAFIALELPEEIKKEIGRSQKDLKKAGVQARWVRPELSHLTLAFLGSITPDKIEPIEASLNEAVSQIEPIQLHLLKIGCFPSPSRARIVFVDLGGELAKLNALAIKIRKGLKKKKIYFDKKPFVSHVTLGRIRKKQNLNKIISKAKVKKVKFVAREVSLNQSTLTETGPVYNKIKQLDLL
jgi:2'-5' RNA ligase